MDRHCFSWALHVRKESSMRNQLLDSTTRLYGSEDLRASRQRRDGAMASWVRMVLLATLSLFTGCATETLFRSNFDPTPVGQPPATVQDVGTANIDGPPGSVIVIA